MKRVLLIVPVLLLAIGVSCSKNDTTSPPSEAPATSAPAASASSATTVKVADSSKGKILTDAEGRSLYTFDNDSAGKSSCEGTCASTWPALTFSGSGTPQGASGLGTITRSDGTKQVTLNDKPLYTYSGDTKAGDTNGDGVGGKWHIAKAA